ncbi:MAG: 50S ribosome-binding GTPase, partial [Hyphomicrobiaceae bacterium]|nr:50S ribosome-binding GTPase [Hyphomicrobiaceae bacterium]
MASVRRKSSSAVASSPPAAPQATPPAAPVAPVVQLVPLADRAVSRTLDGVLHVLTCGSVDDGKSTLIGRLLFDASGIYDDQRETIARSAAKTGKPDYSLLVDGLVAEREQGITIDIAWRYFDSNRRRIVIIDSPGHEQYTRNMASGASHADVAIMLVDARSGVKRQ